MPFLLGAPFPAGSNGTASLDNLAWFLPFLGDSGIGAPHRQWCAAETQVLVAKMGGTPGDSYDVELRFFGVVELRSYSGGENDGAFFQIGGSPAALPPVDFYNVYALVVSSPPQTYYVNRGTSGGNSCQVIDYTRTIQIDAGATVTLVADAFLEDPPYALELVHSLSVPGVSNPAQPVPGQWVIMRFLSATRR